MFGWLEEDQDYVCKKKAQVCPFGSAQDYKTTMYDTIEFRENLFFFKLNL